MSLVLLERPPNYDAIDNALGPLPEKVVFAYGDKIYAPGAKSVVLPDDLIVHERVHFGQQAVHDGPEAWWERYLTDAEFRLAQEVEAYRAQIAWWPTRPGRRAAKKRAIRDLMTLYGFRIPLHAAERLLALPPR